MSPSRELVPIFITVMGVPMLVAMPIYAICMARRARSWIESSARIVDCFRYPDIWVRGVMSERKYFVRYEYTVADKVFQGRRVQFDLFGDGSYFLDAGARKDMHELFLNSLAGGGTIAVFYDPQRPERSVLIREPAPSQIILPLIGLLLLGFFWVVGLSLAARTVGH